MSGATDVIRRFSFEEGSVRGQWVRLAGVLEVLNDHQAYPDNVASLLAEMLAAVALVADGIKFQGAVALQSRGPGPLTTLLAECRERQLLRGIARWPASTPLPESSVLTDLHGAGALTLTLIPDDYRNTYQGVVGITESSLAANLEQYFANSEQLPTRLLLAASGRSVTGLLLQRLPDSERATDIEIDANQAFWREVEARTRTLATEELAAEDPAVLPRHLYGGRGLTLQPARALRFACTCTRKRALASLRAFTREDLLELIDESAPPKQPGEILVTCEICGAVERFDTFDVHLLFEPNAPAIH